MIEQPLLKAARAKNDPEITGTCLMLVNPGEASYGATIAKKRGGTLHRLFHTTLSCFSDMNEFWVGPCVGSPMAVMTLEKLITLGLKKLIVFGWCGSLSPELEIGDLLIPQVGYSDEGVSRHYPLKTPPKTSHALEHDLGKLFTNANRGKIWTTDAPFRELPKDITNHRQNGLKAVDMEFTALCTVCNFYNIEIAGLMVVSDELFHAVWKGGITSKRFKKKAKSALTTLMDNLPQ